MQIQRRDVSIPGFTAERSLYARRAQYSMTAARFLSAQADIQPAAKNAACDLWETKIIALGDLIGWAVATRNWEDHKKYTLDLQGTLTHYRWGRCGVRPT